MFDPVLNFDPATYEAIIAAFVVLGLIQSFALRRKWWQAHDLKHKNHKLAEAATKALFKMMTTGFVATAGLARKLKLAEARADAMQERAESAEAEVRAMMQAAADEDDAADEAARTENNPFTGRPDIETLIFGDSHFGVADHVGVGDHARFASRQPARNSAHNLAELFALLDGPGRNRGALDDLIGNPNVRIVNGGDLVHGGFARGGFVPNGRGGRLDIDDILSAIKGDVSGLENALGGKCAGVVVVGEDGRPLPAAERDALIRDIFGEPKDGPSFDPINFIGGADAAAAGTALHEEIEKSLAARGDTTAAQDFGPDSGGQPDIKGTQDYGRPDESCSTQQPHGYAASSPRAG